MFNNLEKELYIPSKKCCQILVLSFHILFTAKCFLFTDALQYKNSNKIGSSQRRETATALWVWETVWHKTLITIKWALRDPHDHPSHATSMESPYTP